MTTTAQPEAITTGGVEPDVAFAPAATIDSLTRALLRGAIVPTLLRLAWPNILVMLAQASTGLIETWWVSRLGTEALAGMALVFPVVMFQMSAEDQTGREGYKNEHARRDHHGRHQHVAGATDYARQRVHDPE